MTETLLKGRNKIKSTGGQALSDIVEILEDAKESIKMLEYEKITL
jgi:hypothetical protein